jgi:glutamine synthetase adenylyltransferase
MQSIRQYRQQAMLRWIYRDVNNLCTLAELTDELSEFAEASIDAAIAYAIKPLQVTLWRAYRRRFKPSAKASGDWNGQTRRTRT